MKALVQTHLDVEHVIALDERAKANGVSRSHLIRKAVAEMLGLELVEVNRGRKPGTRIRAYAGGTYLGTFDTIEEVEAAKLAARKPAKQAKPFRAYGGGRYLGCFATQDEADEAKRNATRKTFVLNVGFFDGRINADVSDKPSRYAWLRLHVDTFKHSSARRAQLEVYAESMAGRLKDSDSMRERLKDAFSDKAAELTEKYGCVCSVVVA